MWPRKKKDPKPERRADAAPQRTAIATSAEVPIDVDDEGPARGGTDWTFVADDTTVRGHISTGSPVRVEGVVEGDIDSAADVEIRRDALVRGSVSGRKVNVAGRVEGQVAASRGLTIVNSGAVVGNISVNGLLVEDGAVLQGQCSKHSSQP